MAWDLPSLKIKDLIIEYVEYDSPLVMESPWWGLQQLLLSVPAPGLCSDFPSQQTMAPGGSGEHLGGTPPDRGWEPWYLPPPTPLASDISRPCIQPVPAPAPRQGLQSKWRLRNTFYPLPELTASSGYQFTNTVWFLGVSEKIFLTFPSI